LGTILKEKKNIGNIKKKWREKKESEGIYYTKFCV